jgi:hypothetical protein
MTTEWSERSEMYGDLRELIDPGFLVCDVKINGLTISLRSLYPSDYYLVQRWSGRDTALWRNHILATSMWTFDGRLNTSRESAREMVDVVRAFSGPVLDRLLYAAIGLYNRTRTATEYLESYLYEEESRRLWSSVGKSSFRGALFRGIPGIDCLGLNTLQQGWSVWNEFEDMRHQTDAEWMRTRAMMSVHVSKQSTAKWDTAESNRKSQEDEYREDVRDRTYWIHKGILKKDKGGYVGDNGAILQTARSADDLADQYHRWVEGDLDAHDEVVESYKRRIQLSIEANQKARERYLQSIERDDSDEGTLIQVVKSQEELNTFLRKRPKLRTVAESDKAMEIYQSHIVPRPSNTSLDDKLSLRTPRIVED